MKDDAKKPKYEVGYGKPPEDTRFEKGQSGNPRGRPKGAKSWKALLDEVLDEKIAINVKGKKKRVTTAQALARHAIHLAFTKNDPKLLTAMGAFKDDVAANRAFPNGFPEDFTLNFENEPRQRYVNGEWILVERAQPWDEDSS